VGRGVIFRLGVLGFGFFFFSNKGKKTFSMQFLLNQRPLCGAAQANGLDTERAGALFSSRIAHAVG